MGKTKTKAKIPGISVDAIHELKVDIPLNRRNDWAEGISYISFATAALGVYYSIGMFLWISLFILISLLMNRRYGSGAIPSSLFLIGVNGFLIYIYYRIIMMGLRDY